MELKKIEPLFKFLKNIYYIYIVVLILAVIIGIYEYFSFQDVPAGYDPNVDLLPVEWLSMIIGLFQLIFVILVFINFLRLIYRISVNFINKFNIELKVKPGWSVGYFFIPILNLYKPYQVVKELLQRSEKNLSINETLLKYWWALWIISNIVGQTVFKYSMNNWSSVNNTTETIIYVISDSLDVILYIIEFKLVSQIAGSYMNNYEEKQIVL